MERDITNHTPLPYGLYGTFSDDCFTFQHGKHSPLTPWRLRHSSDAVATTSRDMNITENVLGILKKKVLFTVYGVALFNHHTHFGVPSVKSGTNSGRLVLPRSSTVPCLEGWWQVEQRGTSPSIKDGFERQRPSCFHNDIGGPSPMLWSVKI